MNAARLKEALLVGAARAANAMPPLRRLVLTVLNRAPALKRRLKRATVSAVATHGASRAAPAAEDALLSPLAKRVMEDLRRERGQRKAPHEAPAHR